MCMRMGLGCLMVFSLMGGDRGVGAGVIDGFRFLVKHWHHLGLELEDMFKGKTAGI